MKEVYRFLRRRPQMSETKQKEKEGLFDPRCARFGFQMVV